MVLYCTVFYDTMTNYRNTERYTERYTSLQSLIRVVHDRMLFFTI